MNIKTITQSTLTLTLGLSLTLLTACSQGGSSAEAEGKLENHIATIEAKVEEDSEWVKSNWEDVDKNYNEMKKDVKNEDAVKTADQRWENITTRLKETEVESRYTPMVVQAYNALGISNEEASMSFVTKENILAKYNAFIKAVDDNKKSYDTNDWADIEVVWDALNKRKNEVEPIATQDNLKIAKLKLEYAGIKTIRKPEAKMEDKLDNKQYN